jgi:DNA-binding NarL/FixJ family response regulator
VNEHESNEPFADRLSPASRLPGSSPVSAGVERLTPTQLRVLRGVHLGLANKQIAFDLGIAEATVKAHMTALMRKLNVRNRTQVAILAEKIAATAPSDDRQSLALN